MSLFCLYTPEPTKKFILFKIMNGYLSISNKYYYFKCYIYYKAI